MTALALAAYVATLPPSFGLWDTGELQTVAAILGIAHPPGCPFFTLLGWTFVHVVPFGDPAWRVSFMCALASALAVGLAYAVARMFGARPASAAVCALGFAAAPLVWKVATRAEVLDIALLMRAVAFAFALRFRVRGTFGDLLRASLAAGLGCATHGIAIFVLPALALLAFSRASARNLRALGCAAGAFIAGLLPIAYLPLRSRYVDAHGLDPNVALGLPRGLPFWNYGDPSTPARLWHFLTGADFHVAGGFAGYLAVSRYFEYEVAFCSQIAAAYGYVGTLLALLGLCVLLTRRPIDGVSLAFGAALFVPYAVAYPDLQQRERYYTFGLWCAAVAAAAGFDYLIELLDLRTRSVARGLAVVALGLWFALVPGDRSQFWGQRADRFGPEYVAQVRAFTPDGAIVLADWAYATPLAYALYVQHAFGRRFVVPASANQYLAEAARWVRRRPVYFVGFEDDLHLAGWSVRRVWSSSYWAYRLTK